MGTNQKYAKFIIGVARHLECQWFIAPGAITVIRNMVHVGIANPQWQGKRSRHSRRMRNPYFCVFGKRPMENREADKVDLNLKRNLSWQTTGIVIAGMAGLFQGPFDWHGLPGIKTWISNYIHRFYGTKLFIHGIFRRRFNWAAIKFRAITWIFQGHCTNTV